MPDEISWDHKSLLQPVIDTEAGISALESDGSFPSR